MLISIGLVILLVGGVWQLRATRLGGIDVRQKHLFSPDSAVLSSRDRRRPWRALADAEKRRSLATILVEVALVGAAAGMVAFVAVHPRIPAHFKLVVVASLGVGTLLVARGLYVRLGLHRPTLEDLADYRRSVATTVDETMAEEFATLYGALESARGEGPDDAAVGVLAAARAGHDEESVVRWAEVTGATDPETVEQRASDLVSAGVLEREDGLAVPDRLDDADPAQLAALADSVLY